MYEACVDTFDYNCEGKVLCMVGGFKGDAFHVMCVVCDIGIEEDTLQGETLGQKKFFLLPMRQL